MSGLVIGIDARAAAESPGGRGRVVRELARHLPAVAPQHRFRLYARRPVEGLADGGAVRWRLHGAPGPLWQVACAVAATRECDAFLATNTYLVPAIMGVPSVAVVYDLVPFDRALSPARGSLAERVTLRLAIRRAHAFVAISDATRRDLVARFPSTASRVHVVHLAADEAFGAAPSEGGTLEKLGVRQPYVLAVGTLEPRKNLARLVEAFETLDAERRGDATLVLAGASGWGTRALERGLERGLGAVRWLGHVADADLAELYRHAELFCFPSLHEGFGLPVLEAMRAGAPVLAARTSSLPEVGGDAARYVDPLDVDAIRAGLGELLADDALRRELARRGLRRAAVFSWERTAQGVLEAIEQSVASRPT